MLRKTNIKALDTNPKIEAYECRALTARSDEHAKILAIHQGVPVFTPGGETRVKVSYRPCTCSNILLMCCRFAPISAGVASGSSIYQSSHCAWSQRTDSSCQVSPLTALTTPSNGPETGADLPVILQAHHDHHPLFRPGWKFNNSKDTGDFCEADLVTRDQRSRSPPNDLGAAVGGLNAEGGRQKTSRPVGDNQRYDRTKHKLKERAPPLRTVASGPSLSTRNGSKTTLVPPQDRLAFRTRNASDDCQSFNTTFSPLPCPPLNKPLPPIPTVRPHASASLPSSTRQSLEYQYFERARAPPSYTEAQVPTSSEGASSDRETVSTRTRIVMGVLGHMVALLKTRDDVSLMEFSNLVISQTRYTHSRPEDAAQDPNTA